MGGHYIYEIIRNLFPKKLTETVIHLLTDHVVLNLCIRFVSEYCLLYIQGYKLNRSRKKDMLRGGLIFFFRCFSESRRYVRVYPNNSSVCFSFILGVNNLV